MTVTGQTANSLIIQLQVNHRLQRGSIARLSERASTYSHFKRKHSSNMHLCKLHSKISINRQTCQEYSRSLITLLRHHILQLTRRNRSQLSHRNRILQLTCRNRSQYSLPRRSQSSLPSRSQDFMAVPTIPPKSMVATNLSQEYKISCK